MFTPGLVSITFRKLSPAEVAKLVAEGGLKSIEWGGDVHVPHGDLAAAREVATITKDAGLEVAAYGSYYRAGADNPGPDFGDVLDSAIELGAPSIRIWPGNVGSADATPEIRARVADDIRRIATMAEEAKIPIALEYHGGTLTDNVDSTLDLLKAIDHPNVLTLWQTANGQPDDVNVANLRKVIPHLLNVHVFHWWPNNQRNPLAEGAERWAGFLQILKTEAPGDRHLLIEFVANDEPEQFLADATALREWIDAA